MEAAISQIVTLTIKGRRSKNEDSLEVREFSVGDRRAVVAAVADGMGGHLSGEIASSMATSEFVRRVESAVKSGLDFDDLRTEIEAAYIALNNLILARYQGSSDLEDMGSTLTTAVLVGDCFLIGNLGDTRAYRITSDDITQLTEDHSAGAESVREGLISELEAKESRYANTLTKFLGSEDHFVPDVFPRHGNFKVGQGEVLLLCTDGISGVLDEIDIFEQVVESKSLREAAERLVDLSLIKGSKDNMSLILIEPAPLARRPSKPTKMTAASTGTKRRRPRRIFLASLIGAILILTEGFLVHHYLKVSSPKAPVRPALPQAPPFPDHEEGIASGFELSQKGGRLSWILTVAVPRKTSYEILFFPGKSDDDPIYRKRVRREYFRINDALNRHLRKYPAVYWQVRWTSGTETFISEKRALRGSPKEARTK